MEHRTKLSSRISNGVRTHGFTWSVAWLLAAAACGASGSSRIEIVKASVNQDPDLEVVATDDKAGVLTVKVKSSNELVTVNVKDIEDGKPLVIKTKGGTGGRGAEVAVTGGNAGSVRVDATREGPDASAATVEAASDTASVQLRAARDRDGKAVTIDTPGGAVAIARDASGRATITANPNAAGASGATITADGGRRTAEVQSQTGGTVQATPGGVKIEGKRPDGSKGTVKVDNGGVTSERSQAGSGDVTPAFEGLDRRTGKITCTGKQNMRLDHIFLNVPGDDAIVVEGACDVLIRRSHIVSGKTAVVIVGAGDLVIEDSVIDGRSASVSLQGTASASAKGSTFHGRVLRSGISKMQDLGGNTWK
ncbi:MAG: hypothetical protein U0Q12_15100 [Vicinamibacterales bacterium]